MWLPSIYIAVLLKMHSAMKTPNRRRIVGAVTPPGDRSAGRSSVNGSGISGWKWAITCSLIGCVRLSLLLLIWLCRLPLPKRFPCFKAMDHLKSPHPGKRVASLVATLLSNLMARCAVPPGKSSRPMSGVEKPMGACAWSMLPVSAVVALVRCVSSVNGWEKQRRSRRPRECTLASSYDRVDPAALAGLEPKTASSGLHAPASAPIPPEQRGRPDRKRMQEYTHAGV